MALTQQQDAGVYRIMLAADGEPKHGGLTPMSYHHETRSVLDDFYSQERERIIREAIDQAHGCKPGTPVYVMTTGFGAVPVTSTIKLYNVPGEDAILQPDYQSKYRISFLNILTSLPEAVGQIAIVYYAGRTQRSFREGIFQILKELLGDYKIRACMYGDKFHLAARWRNLCRIFNALNTGDDYSLEDMKRAWVNQNGAIAPFFKWF